jgi:hypothetical protein
MPKQTDSDYIWVMNQLWMRRMSDGRYIENVDAFDSVNFEVTNQKVSDGT